MARNSFYGGAVAEEQLIANSSEDARLAEASAIAAAASQTSAANSATLSVVKFFHFIATFLCKAGVRK